MYGKYPHRLSPDVKDAYNKAIRVIISCKTYLHMHTALKYIMLFKTLLDITEIRYYDALVKLWWLKVAILKKHQKRNGYENPRNASEDPGAEPRTI